MFQCRISKPRTRLASSCPEKAKSSPQTLGKSTLIGTRFGPHTRAAKYPSSSSMFMAEGPMASRNWSSWSNSSSLSCCWFAVSFMVNYVRMIASGHVQTVGVRKRIDVDPESTHGRNRHLATADIRHAHKSNRFELTKGAGEIGRGAAGHFCKLGDRLGFLIANDRQKLTILWRQEAQQRR